MMIIKPLTSQIGDVVPQLEQAILSTLKTYIDDAKKRIEEKAKMEFEGEVRTILGTVAINLSNYYSLERVGGDLVIHVKLENLR